MVSHSAISGGNCNMIFLQWKKLIWPYRLMMEVVKKGAAV